jgi:hypothetical protein
MKFLAALGLVGLASCQDTLFPEDEEVFGLDFEDDEAEDLLDVGFSRWGARRIGRKFDAYWRSEMDIWNQMTRGEMGKQIEKDAMDSGIPQYWMKKYLPKYKKLLGTKVFADY